MPRKQRPLLERFSYKAIHWLGTPASIVTHSVFFLIHLLLILLGFPIDRVLLLLTTIVSLEAIYLTLFLQMSINRQHKHWKDVASNIDEIQEDIEEMQEDDDEPIGSV